METLQSLSPSFINKQKLHRDTVASPSFIPSKIQTFLSRQLHYNVHIHETEKQWQPQHRTPINLVYTLTKKHQQYNYTTTISSLSLSYNKKFAAVVTINGFINSMFKPQQRCYSFADLCCDNQTLRSSPQLACPQISFGHNFLLYVPMMTMEMVMVVQEIEGLFFHYQIAHLGLQGLMPCLVANHSKMVAMMPLGKQVCPHHYLPAIIQIYKFPSIRKCKAITNSLGTENNKRFKQIHSPHNLVEKIMRTWLFASRKRRQ